MWQRSLSLASSLMRPPPRDASLVRHRRKRQVSSGGVIVRRARGGFQVCLIARRHEGRLIWGLPKGHVEAGEDHPTTAVREVREETGLLGKPITRLGSVSYWFLMKPDRTRYFKRVHFYLLQYLKGRTGAHDYEVDRAAWMGIDDAMKRLTYGSERTILRKATRYLATIRRNEETDACHV